MVYVAREHRNQRPARRGGCEHRLEQQLRGPLVALLRPARPALVAPRAVRGLAPCRVSTESVAMEGPQRLGDRQRHVQNEHGRQPTQQLSPQKFNLLVGYLEPRVVQSQKQCASDFKRAEVVGPSAIGGRAAHNASQDRPGQGAGRQRSAGPLGVGVGVGVGGGPGRAAPVERMQRALPPAALQGRLRSRGALVEPVMISSCVQVRDSSSGPPASPMPQAAVQGPRDPHSSAGLREAEDVAGERHDVDLGGDGQVHELPEDGERQNL
mmetsp:Transcript_132466/g.424015  ORF Transcript_132466/g.424015 Transcript_132466/m.424015 type:complete len:267 (-) Transcript_132466:397-1197(-)